MKLIKILDLDDRTLIWNGAIFRHFNVGRLDSTNREEDYYDLMLFGLKDIFYLINVTQNSNKRGQIAVAIENETNNHFILSIRIKDFFKDNPDIYLISDELNQGYISKE